MTGMFSGWHWIILLLVVVILFGANRLPHAARSLGRSMRVFNSEVKELKSESKVSAEAKREEDDKHPA